MPRIRTLFAVLFAVLAVVVILPRTVSAHAVLMKATPGEGAVVSGPNAHFELQFNSKVDIDRSQLSLLPAAGEATTLHIASGATPAIMVADAQALQPGDYTVRWQVLAHDGHITRGTYKIHVK